MASAKLNIEVNGKQYGLYFGMASVRIFQERSSAEYLRLVKSGVKEPTQADSRPYKTFAFVIHSGLCNMADILDEQRPEFIDSYALSEDISRDAELCETINRVWSESQPVVEMLEKLNNSLETEKKKPSEAYWEEVEAFAFGELGLTPDAYARMTYRHYVNLCVGNKFKQLRQDGFKRDLLYYTIKGWADPKTFKVTKERFRPLEGDDISQITMPTPEELAVYDQNFRQLANKRWLE